MTTDLETISMLRDSFERYCADHYDFLARSQRLNAATSYSDSTWQALAEFGFLSACLPESLDGLDADAYALGALSEVTGKHMLLEPFLACAVIAPSVLRWLADAALQAELLPLIASGSLKLLLTQDHVQTDCLISDGHLSGRQLGVLHGDIADQFLVPARNSQGQSVLCLVSPEHPNLGKHTYRLVDGRGAANLSFDAVPASLVCSDASRVFEALQQVRDMASAALCAEEQAIAQALLNTTNEYLKVRQQFGKALATNQALQHRMADLYLLSKEIQALTQCARLACSQTPVDRRTLYGARAYCIQAARRIASEAIQLHGGLGITEELQVSHYVRRLMVNASQYGSREEHFEHFAQLSLPEQGAAYV